MSGQPTDEEIAAAMAALRLALQRRERRGDGSDGGSRWLRTGRIEAVTPAPAPAGWRTATWLQ